MSRPEHERTLAARRVSGAVPAVTCRRRLLSLAVFGLIVVASAYAMFVRTRLGQTIGDTVYLSRVDEGRMLRHLDKVILALIDLRVLALMGLVLLVVAAIRRQWLVGIVVVTGYAAAMVSAEVLKVVLPRPELAVHLESLMGGKAGLNTFPSGHATLATGLVIGMLVLSPARARPWVAGVGMVVAMTVNASVLLAGWHRPSDAIGGTALALWWLGLAAAIAVRIGGAGSTVVVRPALLPWMTAGLVAAAAVVFVGARGSDLTAGAPGPSAPHADAARMLGATATLISAWAAVAIALVAATLGGIDLNRRVDLLGRARSLRGHA